MMYLCILLYRQSELKMITILDLIILYMYMYCMDPFKMLIKVRLEINA